MKRQVTIKDIAEKLGVSPSTVSRSLKDHPDISIKTRNAVKELANLLGYKPNLIALHLKNSRTNTIGLLVPEIEHHFFSSIINGIEEVAYQNNYNVLIVQSNESYLREVLNTQTLLGNRVDGMLVSFSKETKDFSHYQQLIDNEIPLVFYDRAVDELQADIVVVDDYSGAYDAVTHLLNRGCRRVAFYSAPQHLLLGKDRLQGYIDAIKHHNMEFNKDLVYSCDTFDSAVKISQSILKKVDRPDGVFAVNDLTAVGVMKAAKRLGIKIPEELKIVGFENSNKASICEPELTSVDQFGYHLGKKAMNILLDRIKSNISKYEPVRHVIKTKLIIRGSS
ncbi:MAG TPA: LacI family DNA-binding transcriptional regulator [Bacteroidales bacterium]|nr:LacI family DNA-binding transcriptional regulator [Bacteroidales bacterium]